MCSGECREKSRRLTSRRLETICAGIHPTATFKGSKRDTLYLGVEWLCLEVEDDDATAWWCQYRRCLEDVGEVSRGISCDFVKPD